MTYPSSVLALSPIAYWELADTVGSGTAVDSSGNGYTLTVDSSMTLGVSGSAIATLPSETVASGSGVAEMGTSSAPQTAVVAWSIAAWFKTSSATSSMPIAANKSGGGSSLTLWMSGGVLAFGLDAAGVQLGVYTTGTFNNGAWHFVVATWAASSGTAIAPSQFTIYVDGAAVGTSTLTTGSGTSPISGIGGETLGTNNGSGWNFWTGDLAHVALFPSQLTSGQVSTLWSAANSAGASPLSGSVVLGFTSSGGVTGPAGPAGPSGILGYPLPPAPRGVRYCRLDRSDTGASLDLRFTAPGSLYVNSIDMGYPTVRTVQYAQPKLSGVVDQTTLFGPRVVVLQGTALPGAAGSRASVLDQLAPFLDPAARPTLTYALDTDQDPRSIVLRADQFSAPSVSPSMRTWQAQWQAPAAVATSLIQQTVSVAPAAGVYSGIVPPLTPPLVLPAGTGDGIITLTSKGTYPTWPVYALYGDAVNPYLQRLDPATYDVISTIQANFEILDGQWLELDVLNRTAYLNGDPTADRYGQLNWPNVDWEPLQPGLNILRYGAASAGTDARMEVIWSDAYLL